MKFKMAPNSLFAILLRSQWWISLAIALAFLALSGALLPPQYRVFGALAGLPFLAIACIRAVRQLRAPSASQVQQILAVATGMNVRAFSDALEAGFRRQGYACERVQGDAAVDLRLTKAGQTTLVACRRWKAANHGMDALRPLVQAREHQGASHAVFVLLSELPAKTQRFAADHRVELLSGAGLAQVLGRDVLR